MDIWEDILRFMGVEDVTASSLATTLKIIMRNLGCSWSWREAKACGNSGSVPQIHAKQMQWAGHLHAHVSMSSGDVTLSQAPFGKCGTSPPSPRDLVMFVPPSPQAHPLARIVGTGVGEKTSTFRGVSWCKARRCGKWRSADAPGRDHCSQGVWRVSLFFVSAFLVVRMFC